MFTGVSNELFVSIGVGAASFVIVMGDDERIGEFENVGLCLADVGQYAEESHAVRAAGDRDEGSKIFPLVDWPNREEGRLDFIKF